MASDRNEVSFMKMKYIYIYNMQKSDKVGKAEKIYTYIYVCMYACMYIYMYVCMYVYM